MGPRVPQNYQGGKEGERFSRESSLRRQQRFSTSALLTLGLRQSFVVGAASPHFHARTTLCTSPTPTSRQSEMSPDIAQCPRGMESLQGESHWAVVGGGELVEETWRGG